MKGSFGPIDYSTLGAVLRNSRGLVQIGLDAAEWNGLTPPTKPPTLPKTTIQVPNPDEMFIPKSDLYLIYSKYVSQLSWHPRKMILDTINYSNTVAAIEYHLDARE